MKLVAMDTSYNILINDVFIHQLNIGLLENKKWLNGAIGQGLSIMAHCFWCHIFINLCHWTRV